MATTITYRKTKTGQWVAYGPAATLIPGATVTVTTKSGQAKQERIASVGREFVVDGVAMVYGYLATDTMQQRARAQVTVTTYGAGGKTRTTSLSSRSCQCCGSSRGVHYVTDDSGVGGYACYRCDDGSVSFC